MLLANREGRPDTGPQLPQPTGNTQTSENTRRQAESQPQQQTQPVSPTQNPVEESIAKLKLVWATLDGKIDEAEIRRIAGEWKDTAETQTLPQIQTWIRRLQDGRPEDLAGEALDNLMRESHPVRMRVMEEFGRMMQESGPVREQAAQLLGAWASRLLGGAASDLWTKLGY